jgi:hypothetical protein
MYSVRFDTRQACSRAGPERWTHADAEDQDVDQAAVAFFAPRARCQCPNRVQSTCSSALRDFPRRVS